MWLDVVDDLRHERRAARHTLRALARRMLGEERKTLTLPPCIIAAATRRQSITFARLLMRFAKAFARQRVTARHAALMQRSSHTRALLSSHAKRTPPSWQRPFCVLGYSVFIIRAARSGSFLTIAANARMSSHSSSEARVCLCFRSCPSGDVRGRPAPSRAPPHPVVIGAPPE